MRKKKIDSLLTKIDWDRSLHERGWAVWANDATGESVEAAQHLGREGPPWSRERERVSSLQRVDLSSD